MTIEIDVALHRGSFALDVAFRAGAGLTALFGRSGSGKTTVIDLIAGLARPDRGRISVDGVVLLDTANRIRVPVHRRRIGCVFQEARLMPHLSVRQNLGFGRWFARRHGVATSGAEVSNLVDMLGIGPLLDRRPAGLSGGERQRVAIGRALLSRPRLLLMDEPLSALDEARKGEILPYIERLRDESGVPIVYVSHAVAEVSRLASTVVVLEGGRVVASGSADAVMRRPDLIPDAAEAGAVLAMTVAAHDDTNGLTRLTGRAGQLSVPRLAVSPGSAVRLRVPARDVLVATETPRGLSARNVLSGQVRSLTETGASVMIEIDCNGAILAARLTRASVRDLDLASGRAVYAIVKSVAFDPQGVGVGQGAPVEI
ncbi:molybdenum ABC transporter ATP-binding protein [Methylobacterium haplocladii]|uniref:Molybdenum import ATP-binding protein ModC n=1 Tax=Methylobacterium haplocladii TaxID=1176176 RepID=A0A512INB3_9HYPH|nr:molybdenum ABC transporter ATP-binding protein [Methylobacterium haplocladii]GEO99175.1 molybdenum import ATP-binding protein ModC [Methylobacterium haplocladii]GJD83181.1 Sulfate/thiosulfate import ATP-binding protein CysA [Methylobacterium haplocladii]GLS58501.1 molybdenum import ATP-binding protein ModC [Methylobacterium haplocladii]